MKALGAVVASGLIASLVGCSSLNVHYDWDTGAEFGSYRAYDWLAQPSGAARDAQEALVRNDLLDQRIKRAVESQLDAKGMRKDTENPDLLVAYHTGVQEKVNVTDWGYRYGDAYWGWGGRQLDVQQYTQGTLILDLVDAETMNMVWRATVSEALESNPSPDRVERRINEVVAEMLKAFPPSRK